jgi:SAM-dependent methyltransferase
MYAHPLKDLLGKFFNRSVDLRKSFYSFLDIFLLRSWHLHRELKKWRKTAPANAHILEIGSGFGQNVYYLSRKGKTWNIVGMDINPDQVSDCNRFFHKCGIHNTVFRVGDVEIMDEQNSFDLIITVDLLEHVEHDEKAMKNIYEALKPGGVLLLTTPIDKTVSYYEPTKRFRNGYEFHELKDKLKVAGFHHVKMHYSYSLTGRISQNLSLKWPLYLTRFSRFLIFLLIPYFILILPLIIILNYIDTFKPHRSGHGMIVQARK